MVKDKHHLGDMLRFIKEGHLSFNEFKHFFPENLANKKLNIATYAEKTAFLCHLSLRESAGELMHVLKVSKYVPKANIVELAVRYCKELNLPGKFY